ncbi:MAG: hypothetical protein JKY32_06455 [Rhizobiales bacterium]|nr:hypothetical protein [Hyphomicrobiales bacterium]
MAISSVNLSSSLVRDLMNTRNQLLDLQRQLGTGKIAETYGGLNGTARLTILSMRAETSAINSYQRIIQNVDVQLKIGLQTVERFAEISSFTKTDFFNSTFDLVDGKKTIPQRTAQTSLDEMVALLNSDVNGRHIFGGRDSDGKPVVDVDTMLNGNGPRAGLNQLVSERRAADLGADGRGRMAINNSGTNVTLSEELAGLPFGMKFVNVTNSLPAGQVTGPTGVPATVSVAFGAPLPADGDQISIRLAMPDGSEEILTMTARASGPALDGEFVIGATATDTATNFEASLGSAVERFAATHLEAASALTASKEFFAGNNTTPPQRVGGPPFDSATGLVAGTAADTVIWYTGDDSSQPARQSAKAKIDDSVTLNYGTRADEEGLVNLIQNLAVLATLNFDETDPNASERYAALTIRTGRALDFPPGDQSPANIAADLAVTARTLKLTSERHIVAANLAATLISEREDSDIQEIAVHILALQTRLQASLQVTSMISQLSLVNFI